MEITFKRSVLSLTVLLAAVLFLVWASGILAWSRINCWTDEIDIRSGRTRYTRYLLWCRVKETISETDASQALKPSDYDPNTPDWRLVATLSPGVHNSPHYFFHGAIYQLNKLESSWASARFTPEAKRESVLRLLSWWQHGGNYFAADKYLAELTDAAFNHSSIGIADLPAGASPK